MKLIPITVPKGFLEAGKYKQAVEDALDVTALAAQSNFELATKTWTHDPHITISHTIGERIIGTDDEIFGYVEHGTPPHIIVPRRGKFLKFNVPYRAKTRPKVLGSTSGGTGSTVVFTRYPIQHPGTKAREFSVQVAKKASDRLLLELHIRFGNIT